jgi:hypothetical protein
MQDHMDPISYDLFKHYDIEPLKERAKKLVPIIQAAFYLMIKKLKKVANVAL